MVVFIKYILILSCSKYSIIHYMAQFSDYIAFLYSIDGFCNCDFVVVVVFRKLSQLSPHWRSRHQIHCPRLLWQHKIISFLRSNCTMSEPAQTPLMPPHCEFVQSYWIILPLVNFAGSSWMTRAYPEKGFENSHAKTGIQRKTENLWSWWLHFCWLYNNIKASLKNLLKYCTGNGTRGHFKSSRVRE